MPDTPDHREPQLPASADRLDEHAPTGNEPALSGAVPKDEAVAHLLFQLKEMSQSIDAKRLRGVTAQCSACGDTYPAWHVAILGDRCFDCYLEVALGRVPDEPGWGSRPSLRRREPEEGDGGSE